MARLARRALPLVLALPMLLTSCALGAVPTPSPADAPRAEPTQPAPAAPAPAPTLVAAPGAPADAARTTEATPTSRLQALLDEVAARHRGRIGVVVKQLKTGETASLNARTQLRAASLYKLFVLYSAFARMEAGGLKEDEILRFGEAAYSREPFAEWPAGTTTSVGCAVQAMVTVSQNAAAAMLIERLGGEAQVTDELFRSGMEWTVLTEERTFTSPSDVAALLEMIWRGQAVSPAASAAMLSLLSEQQRNDRIPLPLPPGVVVAHKTGELTRIRHDAGIVFAPSGPYLLVAMVQDAPSDAEAHSTIVDLSQAVYAYFEGGQTASYRGLPPRLAGEVFQTPDERGRLTPLADGFAQTLPLGRAGAALASGAEGALLRDVAVPDLLALQAAATNAGARFWVTAAYRPPSGSEWTKATPSGVVSCDYRLPPRKPTPTASVTDPAATPTPPRVEPPPPTASQLWLGTVVGISDSPTGEDTELDYAASFTGGWLLAHAWEYGFVPALPESPEGAALGYEPWTLRWVGRDMAAHLQTQTAEGGRPALAAALDQAARELSAAGKRAPGAA